MVDILNVKVVPAEFDIDSWEQLAVNDMKENIKYMLSD